MIDIDNAIDELVLKYGINNCNSMFSKSVKAKAIIRNYLKELLKYEKRILLLSNSRSDFEEFERAIKNYVKFDITNSLLINKDLDNIEGILEKINAYDIILIVSYDKHSEICFKIRSTGKECALIYDLYEIFLNEDLYFNCEFYKIGHYIHDYYKDIFYDKQNYKNASDNKCKDHYLQQIILDHILIRDFLNTKKWIDIYVSAGYSNCSRYIKFWNELECFLNSLKEKIRAREQRDIIIEWIDSLESDDVHKMPFLKEKKELNLYIPNSGTVTPWTIPTFYTMFMGSKVVDDHSFELEKDRIGIEESQRIKSLLEKGYDFVCIGDSCMIFKNDCDYQYYGKWSYVCPLNHWMLLKLLLEKQKPCVILVYNLHETHFPYISANLEDAYPEYFKNKRIANPAKKNQDIINQSNLYLDEQLQYYMDFLNNHTVKIYMSDHGKGELFNRWRTVLIIEGNNIKKGIYNEMFSLIDFDKLLDYAIAPNNSYFERLFRSHIEIQDTDIYGWSYEQLIANPISIDHLLGYRGICTKEEMLIKRNDGKQFLYKFPQKVNVINDGRNSACLKHLESLIGSYQIDINQFSYFEQSRLIRKAIEYYYKRIKSSQEVITKKILELVETFSKEKKVAIRGGGEHTEKLLQIIKDTIKISYIIDKKPDQILKTGNYQYILPTEIINHDIDIVILSSYSHRVDMQKELLLFGIRYDIIDIYKYLENNNIILNQPFYGAEMIEEIDFKNAYRDIYANN